MVFLIIFSFIHLPAVIWIYYHQDFQPRDRQFKNGCQGFLNVENIPCLFWFPSSTKNKNHPLGVFYRPVLWKWHCLGDSSCKWEKPPPEGHSLIFHTAGDMFKPLYLFYLDLALGKIIHSRTVLSVIRYPKPEHSIASNWSILILIG